MEPSSAHITLSDLTFLIEESIYQTFNEKTIWIIAETSDIKNYPDRQYCFVTLVEKNEKGIIAKMDAVIWRSHYSIIKAFEKSTEIKFDKNLKLLLIVSVQYNAQYGLKLQINDIDSSYTLGNLELERNAILSALIKNNPNTITFIDGNYVTINKKIEPPLVIQNIALITAPDSDGQRDFKHELFNNSFGYKFRIDEYLCQIQGKNAAVDIVKQLEKIQAAGINYELIAIVRGGGSQVDFSAFDNYEVALAVASSKMMVLTGIGHERNISIADLMSYKSVKTPTKAASFIVENNRFFEENLIVLKDNLLDKIKDFFDQKKYSLNYTKDLISDKLERKIQKENYLLQEKQIIIKHLNPANILKKGYAILKKNGAIVSDPTKIQEGDTIGIFLKESYIETVVLKNTKESL